MAAAVPIIQGVAAVAGFLSQRSNAKKARQAQENASKVANKQASIQRQREIRQRLAASRVQRAHVIASGFSAGSPGASTVSGAAGGIQSDVASNVGFSNQMFGLEQARVGYLNQAANYQSQGQQAASVFGGIQDIAGLFKSTAFA